MNRSERGRKHVCPECECKYYDLKKERRRQQRPTVRRPDDSRDHEGKRGLHCLQCRRRIPQRHIDSRHFSDQSGFAEHVRLVPSVELWRRDRAGSATSAIPGQRGPRRRLTNRSREVPYAPS
jgi:hypothetical protein